MTELKNEKEQHDTELTQFNEELGRRLASLDRGEIVDPASVRARLRRKSRDRRQRRARGVMFLTGKQITISGMCDSTWPGTMSKKENHLW
jgi:hypothetical protein